MVGVYRAERLLLTAKGTDGAAERITTIHIEGHAAKAPLIHKRVECDPFTGKLLGRH